MCYLVVKNKSKRGCIALKTTHGQHLVSLKRTLNDSLKEKGIQIVTISRPTAFGEYAPYSFAQSESEFISAAQKM